MIEKENLNWRKYSNEIRVAEFAFAEEFYKTKDFVKLQIESEEAYQELTNQANKIYPKDLRKELLIKYSGLFQKITSYIIKFEELTLFQNFYLDLKMVDENIESAKKEIFYAMDDFKKFDMAEVLPLNDWLKNYQNIYFKILDQFVFNLIYPNKTIGTTILTYSGILVPKNEIEELIKFLEFYKTQEDWASKCFNKDYRYF